MVNPLAIGVTLGGLALDVIVPRPKPRIGPDLELLSPTPDPRTPLHSGAGALRRDRVASISRQ